MSSVTSFVMSSVMSSGVEPVEPASESSSEVLAETERQHEETVRVTHTHPNTHTHTLHDAKLLKPDPDAAAAADQRMSNVCL